MNLRRRLAALEKRLITEPTLLMMPDGSTARIPGRGEYLLKLFVVERERLLNRRITEDQV